MLAFKLQIPANHTEESIQQPEQCESFKSRKKSEGIYGDYLERLREVGGTW
jgi:hypothetical protein